LIAKNTEGGVLLDQGIHMVDFMRIFGGNFPTVCSFISNNHWGYNDNAFVLMAEG
jgi:predicted dehydrogenase